MKRRKSRLISNNALHWHILCFEFSTGFSGPTKQQNGTKCNKPINQQNNEIFCYFIPKQQNKKPMFC